MMMVKEKAQRNGLMNNAALSATRPSLTILWGGAAGEAPERIIRRCNPACRCNGLRYFSTASSCTFSRLIAENKWRRGLGFVGFGCQDVLKPAPQQPAGLEIPFNKD